MLLGAMYLGAQAEADDWLGECGRGRVHGDTELQSDENVNCCRRYLFLASCLVYSVQVLAVLIQNAVVALRSCL